MPLDRGEVVRDQPVRTFDRDLDMTFRDIEHGDAATGIAAMLLGAGKGNRRHP